MASGKGERIFEKEKQKVLVGADIFPALLPDFNPQEHIWKAAKKQTCHNSEKDFPEKIKKFSIYIETRMFSINFLKKYV